MKVRWIDAGRVNGIKSQSIYHGLGNAFKKGDQDIVSLQIPGDPYLCISYFQDAALELDLTYCRKHNLPVIRRQTGGGAVYIDNNQLFIQWIFNPESLPQKNSDKFSLFLKPIVETYKFFGINAYVYRDRDVHVNGKKIVGTGGARIGNAEVLTGNIILDFDPSPMIGSLNLPDIKFRELLREAMTNSMTSVKNEIGHIPPITEIKEALQKFSQAVFYDEIEVGDFTSGEWMEIDQQERKLKSKEWTFLMQNKPKSFRLIKIHGADWLGWCKCLLTSGLLELIIRWSEVTIESMEVGETTFSTTQISLLKQCLEGSLFEKSAIEDAIHKKTIMKELAISNQDLSIISTSLMQLRNEQKLKIGS